MRSRLDWLLYELGYWCVFWSTTLGFRLRVRNRTNVPRTGGVLLVANHQSYIDPVCIAVGVPRHVAYLAKKQLFRVPVLGWYLSRVNCVPIDQEGVAKEGLKAILAKLNDGWPIMVFPEGSRSDDGSMLPFSPGVLMIIKRTRASVVPVGIAGAYQAWSRHATFPRPASVAVVYGTPRTAESLAALPREEALAILAADIAALKEEAESIRRQ